MAWLVGDSFDATIGSGNILNGDVWSSITGPFSNTGATGKYGRGLALQVGNNSLTVGILTTIDFGNVSTIFVNMVMLVNNIIGSGTQGHRVGFRLQDGATNQCGFWMTDAGTFVLTNGLVGGATVASSTQLIPNGQPAYHHVQVKIVIHNTLGSVEMRLNGDTSNTWAATGINTRSGSVNAYCNKLVINSNHAVVCLVDDFFCFSDQGAAPNDWLPGEACALLQVPTSDVTSQWTRNGGASNFSRVSQQGASQDGDTTYNGSNTVGQEDKFGMSALAVSPMSILMTQTKALFRCIDSGPHKIKLRMDSAGNVVDGTDRRAVISYIFAQLQCSTDPATGLPWTEAGIEAAQVGYVNVL